MLHMIIWLRGKLDNKEFPYLESFAEGDQEFETYWPLTSTKHKEIVLAGILPEELGSYDWMKPRQPGLIRFQNRINDRLSRTDLRVTWRFISANNWELTPNAKSVSQFPNVPETSYMSIYNEDEHTVVIREETVEEFVSNGGIFLING